MFWNRWVTQAWRHPGKVRWYSPKLDKFDRISWVAWHQICHPPHTWVINRGWHSLSESPPRLHLPGKDYPAPYVYVVVVGCVPVVVGSLVHLPSLWPPPWCVVPRAVPGSVGGEAGQPPVPEPSASQTRKTIPILPMPSSASLSLATPTYICQFKVK